MTKRNMTKRSGSSQSVAHATTKNDATSEPRTLTGDEFDAMHDAGVDLEPYMDYDHARRTGRQVQRVNVDFPIDLLNAIDREADRIGVTRQAFIKLRLADTLTSASAPRVVNLMEVLKQAMAKADESRGQRAHQRSKAPKRRTK